MANALLSHPEALVAEWRAGGGTDNPAGPLFSDVFTESDLTSNMLAISGAGCSACTASRPVQCC